MFKKIKIISFVLLAISFTASIPIFSASAVLADSKSSICQGIGVATGDTSCGGASDATGLNNIIANVVNILSALVGVVAVVMIVVGGLKFITSGGDSSKTASARSTILYALIGLVIVALAQIIVHFVLTTTKG